LLGVIMMVWFFATPIIYPTSMIPGPLKFFLALNPMAVFTDLYRELMLRHQVVWSDFSQAAVLAVCTAVFGMWFFMRARPAFGDVL
jgi:lipopolysaccharide transport system permease protein